MSNFSILERVEKYSILSMAGALILSYPLGFYLVYIGRMSEQALSYSFKPITFFIAGIPLPFNVSVPIGYLFFSLWTIYIMLGFLGLKMKISNQRPFLKASYAFAILFVINNLIEILQERLGIEIGSLQRTDPLRDFTSYSLAPLTEEIGFRITIIGLVVIIMLTGKLKMSDLLKLLWHPKVENPSDKRYLYFVILGSAVIFGLAHIFGGWKLGKFTEATFFGIFAGILYIKYSLIAPILLHWSFNYVLTSYHYLSSFFQKELYESIFTYFSYLIGITLLFTYFIKKLRVIQQRRKT